MTTGLETPDAKSAAPKSAPPPYSAMEESTAMCFPDISGMSRREEVVLADKDDKNNNVSSSASCHMKRRVSVQRNGDREIDVYVHGLTFPFILVCTHS